MKKSVVFTVVGAVLAATVLLLAYPRPDTAAPAAAAVARPAIGIPAPAVAAQAHAPTAAAQPGTAGGAPGAAPSAAGAAIPAFASDTQRAATREQREQALPVFLQAAEATLARVRGELALLEARGAPAAEIAAKAEQLRQLTEVRAQVLARNADITPAR